MYSGEHAGNGNSPLPPVITTPVAATAQNPAASMAPPFVGHPTITGASEQMPELSAAESLDAEDMAWYDSAAQQAETDEPVFEADAFETEAAFAGFGDLAARPDSEFPLDAFIIPEHPRSLPSGVAPTQLMAGEAMRTPVIELADRLEKLSHRLRTDDAQAVIGKLASGDKLDAMFAGLLAGYLSGMP